jgi:hypothetical protein
MIHVTDVTGEGGGGKNTRDENLECEMKGLRLSLRWFG